MLYVKTQSFICPVLTIQNGYNSSPTQSPTPHLHTLSHATTILFSPFISSSYSGIVFKMLITQTDKEEEEKNSLSTLQIVEGSSHCFAHQ